jgi:beta-lactamase superfamily II metal-dependent hydrolase
MRLLTGVTLAALLTLSIGSPAAAADVVVPVAEVTTRVVVRASATSQSADIGSLLPGEQAELLGSVPNWYRVRLANGTEGFVSKRWTRVNSGTPATAVASMTMDVVDVGTGLGILVRGPDFTLVYDGGSNDDQAQGSGNRMLAYLKAVAPSLTRIDHLILSHPHTDHVLLLPDLFAEYQVRDVWDSGRLHDICGYRTFITAVRDEPGVSYHSAIQGSGPRDFPFIAKPCFGDSLPAETVQVTVAGLIDQIPISLGQGATMTFLHADGAAHSSPNENSLVVRLDLGNTRILLMGDAEAGERDSTLAKPPTASSIEGALLACCQAQLSAEVLVVGHHGSMTSSRKVFLNAVGATIAIVSSGPKEYPPVVLPDSEVINELLSRGQVFRTDVNDQACARNPAKIGPDADDRPGGCDNIRVVISATGAPQVSVWHGADIP